MKSLNKELKNIRGGILEPRGKRVMNGFFARVNALRSRNGNGAVPADAATS